MGKIKKIMFTGGHAGSTAYATIEELVKRKGVDLSLYFVGAKFSVEGKKVPTLEEKTLPRFGVKYESIVAGRVQRRFTKHTIPSLLKIPVGFVQAYGLISRIKPDLVVSFGGYVSVPVSIVAKLFSIPVLIHEQTVAYGRANKVVGLFADKIALARKSSLKFFPSEKCIVVGNPISQAICEIEPKKILPKRPTLFVTGGSRGAEVINETLSLILPKLVDHFDVIHQVGVANEDKYKFMKKSLRSIGAHYEVFGVIDSHDWPKFIKKSDIIISRAGANIVSEIMTARRPSILIPIPWTFANEQVKNAKMAEDYGIADILSQDDLSPENLIKSIKSLMLSWKNKINKVKTKESPDVMAAKRLVDIIFGLLS